LDIWRSQVSQFFSFYFLIFFLGQGSHKRKPQEVSPTTEVGCGLQKISTFSEKRAKPLTIFFLYFPDFFGNFDEGKQGIAEFGSGRNRVRKLHKKFQIFSTNERKVMPVLLEVPQVRVLWKEQRGGEGG
jgi:hypothetical protein